MIKLKLQNKKKEIVKWLKKDFSEIINKSYKPIEIKKFVNYRWKK